MLAPHRVTPLERLQVEVLDHIVHEKHRARRVQRIPHERREQLPLVLLVRLELDLTPHDRHTYQMANLGSVS